MRPFKFKLLQIKVSYMVTINLIYLSMDNKITETQNYQTMKLKANQHGHPTYQIFSHLPPIKPKAPCRDRKAIIAITPAKFDQVFVR